MRSWVKMRPIPGLVIGKKMGFLKIQLQSGSCVYVSELKGLGFGDKVWVCYDFTRMDVRDVLTDEEYHEADQFEEPPDEEPPYPGWLPPHKALHA
jgi:hypothetical protein